MPNCLRKTRNGRLLRPLPIISRLDCGIMRARRVNRSGWRRKSSACASRMCRRRSMTCSLATRRRIWPRIGGRARCRSSSGRGKSFPIRGWRGGSKCRISHGFSATRNNYGRHDPCLVGSIDFGASPMLIELRLSRATGTTLQAQIAEQLRLQIVGGRLQPGYELPPSRELARQYGVSRNTIIHAYEHLISEGYLATVKGVRTIVAGSIPETCLSVEKEDAAPSGKHRSAPRAPIVFDGENLAVPAVIPRST